jgi:hypothetical protein
LQQNYLIVYGKDEVFNLEESFWRFFFRTNFFFGIVIKRADLAFSAPTDDGRQFFKKYTHSNRLFIY